MAFNIDLRWSTAHGSSLCTWRNPIIIITLQRKSLKIHHQIWPTFCPSRNLHPAPLLDNLCSSRFKALVFVCIVSLKGGKPWKVSNSAIWKKPSLVFNAAIDRFTCTASARKCVFMCFQIDRYGGASNKFGCLLVTIKRRKHKRKWRQDGTINQFWQETTSSQQRAVTCRYIQHQQHQCNIQSQVANCQSTFQRPTRFQCLCPYRLRPVGNPQPWKAEIQTQGSRWMAWNAKWEGVPHQGSQGTWVSQGS